MSFTNFQNSERIANFLQFALAIPFGLVGLSIAMHIATAAI